MPPIEIAGEGTLELSEEQRKAQYLIVTCMFKDYPLHFSQNFRTPRRRLFFGYAHVMVGEYVLSEVELQYDGQIVYEWRNITAQLNTAIWCAQKKIRDLIISSNNGTPGTVPMFPVDENALEVLGCPVTEIRYKLIPGVKILTNTIFAAINACDGYSNQVGVPVPPDPVDEGDELGDEPPRIGDGTGEPNGIGGVRPKPPEPNPSPTPTPTPGTLRKIIISATANTPGPGGVPTQVENSFEGTFAEPISVDVVKDQPNPPFEGRTSYVKIFSNGNLVVANAAIIERHIEGSYNTLIQYQNV